MTVLRPYQAGILDRIDEAWREVRRVLAVLPTGAGKTIVFAETIGREVTAHRKVLVLAHRREIINQTVDKVKAAGVTPGMLMAGRPHRPLMEVQVASIATLHARAVRRDRIAPPPADLVIIDEAHHTPAPTWLAIVALYPDARVLGLTATPCRDDGRRLGSIFERMIVGPQVAELVAGGYLVAARCFAPPHGPNLKGVRTRGGDYAQGELEQRMNVPKLVGDVVEQWLKRGEGRPTVVFASGVAHSLHLRDSFRAAGVLAEHIDGETPTAERDATLTQLADGTVNVVCNAMVLTEGWDCPAVSCIVLARPTRKLGLFRQMVGRGLRPHPGKTDCLIIDHSGAVHAHGFPDDDIEWTLEPDRTAGENGAHDARQDKHSARGILECSMCSALRVAGEACAACGFLPPPPPPRAVACLPGDLDEVDRSGRTIPAQEHSHDERMLFFGEMAAYGRARGFKPGFAAAKYRERYHNWPPWGAAPPSVDEIRPATRRWLQSRAIAYARAREREERP